MGVIVAAAADWGSSIFINTNIVFLVLFASVISVIEVMCGCWFVGGGDLTGALHDL